MGWKKHLWPEWKIISLLGSGAYGKVYKIKRQDIGGTYYAALKVVSFPNDESSLELLRNKNLTEAQITSHYLDIAIKLGNEFALMEKLKGNTNIVSYEDHKIVPHEDGVGWDVLIRMEYLTTLEQFFEQNQYDERMVIRLGIDICKALKLCESEGIIHKDIKPGNIFISNHGDFELGDFSIAQVMSNGKIEYSSLGTYSYIAPEVYLNKKYDYTVDIYSLGLILYRLVNNGWPPFCPSNSVSVSQEMAQEANERRLNGEPLPKPEKVSDGLASIILKACSYNPKDRYQTAEAFSNALSSCLENEFKSNKDVHKYTNKMMGFLEESEGETESWPNSEEVTLKKENMNHNYFKMAGDL